MDATHFRQRAARAREMAQSGDDFRLSRMLLEVALDLDAEAEAIEAGGDADRRSAVAVRRSETCEARLYPTGSYTDGRPVQIIDLSLAGARFRTGSPPESGSLVTLELPTHSLRLEGAILRVHGPEAAMAFDRASSADPAFSRLLQSEVRAERVRA